MRITAQREYSVSDPPLAFKITSPEKAGPGFLYVCEDNKDNEKVANLEGSIDLDGDDDTEGEPAAEIYTRFKESELLEQHLAQNASTTFDEVLDMDDTDLNKVEDAMMKISMGALKALSTELNLSIDTQGTRLTKKHIVMSLMDTMGEIRRPDP